MPRKRGPSKVTPRTESLGEKYELVPLSEAEQARALNGTFPERKFFRIKALRSFTAVNGKLIRKGTLGGIIESTATLTQDGHCWIDKCAIVGDEAQVVEDAYIGEQSTVRGHAYVGGSSQVWGQAYIGGGAKVISSHIEDEANISGKALVNMSSIAGRAKIKDNASVFDSQVFATAIIAGNARVSGDCVIEGHSVLGDLTVVSEGSSLCNVVMRGRSQVRRSFIGSAYLERDADIEDCQTLTFRGAWISEHAYITSEKDVVFINGIGVKHSNLTAYLTRDGTIFIKTPFFTGSLVRFLEHIKESSKDRRVIKEHKQLAKFIRLRLKR